MVGRLHYSLSPTLSAHFRRGVCASEVTALTSTGVLVSDRDYRDRKLPRSIRHITYFDRAFRLGSERFERWRLKSEAVPEDAGVVGVLLRGRGVGATQAKQSQER